MPILRLDESLKPRYILRGTDTPWKTRLAITFPVMVPQRFDRREMLK